MSPAANTAESAWVLEEETPIFPTAPAADTPVIGTRVDPVGVKNPVKPVAATPVRTRLAPTETPKLPISVNPDTE